MFLSTGGNSIYHRFFSDMIMKDMDCQIKAELMKDKHQTATPLSGLQDMTWLSRSRNIVTHPP